MSSGARRVLVVTNMWPADDSDYTGIFVKQQVEALRAVAPAWTFDVVEIAGPRGRGDYLAAVPRVRRALRRGYDAVHAHYGLTGATVAMARPPIPMLVTLHGNDVNWGWQLRISRWGARRARVIAVSEQLAKSYGRGDAVVLPCGVPMDIFRPVGKAAARRRLSIEERAPVLLFPADPANPVKDYGLFRSMVDALPAPLREQVVERVLGAVAPPDVALEMAAADVVVLTSVAEGSPMVVKEALACGTAVVSVDVGDVRAVAGGLPGCAVVERDARALAVAVAATLDRRDDSGDPRLRRERIAALGLDGERIARELLAIYEEVLGRPTPVRSARAPVD